MKNFLIAISIFLTVNSFGQLNLNVLPDNLNPDLIKNLPGIITIKDSQVEGFFDIDLRDNQVYFNDGNLIFSLKELSYDKVMVYDLIGVNLKDNIGKYNKADLIKLYRASIYNKLGLNEIIYSSSKNLKVRVDNSKFKILDEVSFKGKVCSISPDKIVLLDSSGEIKTITNANFNYLQLGKSKYFSTGSCYFDFFNQFQEQLKKVKDLYLENFKKMKIEEIIAMFGPIENVYQIDADRKIIQWEIKEFSQYSSSSSISVTNRVTPYSFINISPIFYSYQNAISNESKSSSFLERSAKKALLFNVTTGKIENFYTNNFFSDLKNGEMFRFINY